MGDPGQVRINLEKEYPPVYLYTQWGAPGLVEVVKKALRIAEGQWDDGPSLARIVFQEMIGDDKSAVHFSIQTYPSVVGITITLDSTTQTVLVEDAGRRPVESSFKKFVGEIYIWADFNALDGGHLPLDFNGSFSDIRRQNVELRDGLHIVVYDDECQADAIVEKVQGEWRARITSEIRNVDSKPGRPG